MARARATFVCQNCGAVTNRWQGRCESCGEWNTIVEEAPASGIGARAAQGAVPGRVLDVEGLVGESRPDPRVETGVAELDRVTGGGFVPGSVLLLGGEPGIGKSTLLLQACAAMALRGERVVYVSGEEAIPQVRLRAVRLGLAQAPVELAAATNVEDIVTTLKEGRRPALVIIDSIQTMYSHVIEFGAGHGHAGARLRPGIDPLCQGERRLGDPRWPRYQGWAGRGAARRRAHGRCGALLRGRFRAIISAWCGR